MSKKQEKFWKIILRSKFFIIAMLGVLSLVCFTAVKSYLSTQGVDREIRDLRQEIETLEDQNQNLGQLIEYLDSNDFKEKEYRTKLGLRKPGEKVIVISKNESIEKSEDLERVINTLGELVVLETKDEQKNNNPEKWWEYFFEK